MKPSHLPAAIACYLEANRPLFISGAPATGKSALVKQAQESWYPDHLPGFNGDVEWRDIRAAQTDPVDWRGLPTILDGRTTWLTPDFLPRAGTFGVMCFDELADAPKLVQSALYQLILDRQLGDYTLPDGQRMIACGNRAKDRAAAGRLSTALASRFGHLEMDTDPADWSEWALGIESNPFPEWTPETPTDLIAPEVLAFIRFRPELLHDFDPARNTELAFPAPRTWEILSNIYQTTPPREIATEIYQGIVGNGAGSEFAAFIRIWRDLPNIDGVLLNPTTAPVPTEPSVLYALVGALSRKGSESTAQRLADYGARLPKEFETMLIRDTARRSTEFQHSTAFTRWTIENQDILL